MDNNKNSSLLTKKEVASFLHIGESTLNLWVRKNKINYIKLGKSVRFRKSDIDKYLDDRTIKARKGF